MWKNLKKLYILASEEGLKIPFAYDSAAKAPSVTLLFAYVTFIIAAVSVILHHIFDGLFVPTVTSIGFWVIAYVIYRMRKLDKFKFNFEERSITLDSEDETPTKKEKEEETD